MANHHWPKIIQLLLGVALGVVLMPQLAAAKAASDSQRYSAMLDWGLRLVWVLALPCGVALLVFAGPLVSVLYHYGAFTAHDLRQTRQYQPLPGWGRLLLQVLLATGVLGAGLYGLAQHVDWVGMRSEPWQRIGLMALVLAGSFVVYFTTLRVIGVDLRALLRRSGHD